MKLYTKYEVSSFIGFGDMCDSTPKTLGVIHDLGHAPLRKVICGPGVCLGEAVYQIRSLKL